MKLTPFVLMTLCVISAIASGSVYAEPESDATRCLTHTDPAPCHRALAGARENTELAEKLHTRACQLGDLAGCHGLVGFLAWEKKDIEAAISVASKNCENGYISSCESAGYFLNERGQPDHARRYYLKSCSGDKSTLRGCDSLGTLSIGTQEKALLEESCAKQQVWACYANGFAEKQAGRITKAKEAFMSGCEKGYTPTHLFCEVAFKYISLPADVQNHFDWEASCKHWRGELAFDAERSKQIEAGITASCKDRSAERISLRTKYQDNRDMVFVLDNLSRD